MNIDKILCVELTSQQREAVIDPAKEILCLACAGSGKSRTLAYRIARLIADGESAESIVAFTFTEKAAESIKRRVAQSLSKVGIGAEVMGAMFIGTIHSYCQHILGKIDATYRQFDVLDENRLKLYIISRYPQIGLAGLRSRAPGNRYFEAIKQLSTAWKTLNDELLDIGDILADDASLGTALKKLKELLDHDQFIDFSLMIRHVVDALVRRDPAAEAAVSQLKHLMVDEYQDVSPNQEELIRQLHRLSDTLFVVGDDDQSIYAWRGADVRNILTFMNRYHDAVPHTLSENFRSTSAIVKSSDDFVAAELGPSRISKNPSAVFDRVPRDLRISWFDDRRDEAAWVAERILALLGTAYEESDGSIRGLTPADFAILMRSTRGSEGDESPRHLAYTQSLINSGLPYSLEAGGGPFERPQVHVLRSTFELLRNGSPNRALVETHFNQQIERAYPAADFNTLVRVLTEWGRQIHSPPGGARRRVYPQKLVYELLEAFGLAKVPFPDEVMRDIGLFSKMIQDVEAVYMSVDSAGRFHDILNFLSRAAETGYDVSTDDVMQRPDAITVSTVHKAKGLEYPVVFVVDVENGRFPANRGGYEGWLPRALLHPALTRGAYQRTPDEEARLFYTALTRSERFLYITGSARLPGGVKTWRQSRFAGRLVHPEISRDPAQLPQGLIPCPQKRRIDETILPTSFSEIKYYLRCPMDYRFRQGFGFSPFIPDMFGFGKTVHTAIEKLHECFDSRPPTQDEAEQAAKRVFHLKHVPKSKNPESNPGPYERAQNKAVEIVRQYAESYTEDFQRQKQVEARFEIPAQDCVISGSIDLLLKEDDRGRILNAEVIDFKAVEGGLNPPENTDLEWTELSVQVQLYAKAATEVLGENAKTGSVHLLKDNQRVNIPISDQAVDAAVSNIEWAVHGILESDYPMRPHREKCAACDFDDLCRKQPQPFQFSTEPPPEIHLPDSRKRILAFSKFED